MRRWMATPLVFAAFAALSPETPRALAQNNDPVEETFLSADGVQLRGLFLKSQVQPANDPVVILLYPPGKDNNMDKGDWKGLATRLSKEGYNVFRFDWRGHGKSTDIKDTKKFWGNDFTAAWNHKYIMGAPVGVVPKKIKNDIFFKDIKGDPTRYAPTFLLDLAAARYHLDTKNDAGDINTSSVYLIGSESAATIGIAWMTAEWNRPKVAPGPNALGPNPRYEFIPQPLVGGITAEAGEDISGAIWLSATRPSPSIKPQLVQDWVAKGAPKLRENNPMLFLHGANDPSGKPGADFFFTQVLVANPPKNSPLQKLEQTFVREVKGTKLVGAQLLGNNKDLGTEDTILKFVDAIQKERAKIVRRNRSFANPYFIDLSKFGMNP